LEQFGSKTASDRQQLKSLETRHNTGHFRDKSFHTITDQTNLTDPGLVASYDNLAKKRSGLLYMAPSAHTEDSVIRYGCSVNTELTA